jgi:single-strand DNA-binding protein
MQETSVTIIGNITSDPSFRVIDSGAPTVNFSVAVNRRWKSKDGADTEKAEFYKVTAWRELASNVGLSLKKGDRVVVIGYLGSREWTDRDGVRHRDTEVTADEIAASLRYTKATVARKKKAGEDGSDTSTMAGSFDDDQRMSDDVRSDDHIDAEFADLGAYEAVSRAA